jgi:hypothetical protein
MMSCAVCANGSSASDGSTDSTVSAISALVNPDAGIPKDDGGPSGLPAYAMAIPVPEGTICTVTPEGVTGDPPHSDTIFAGHRGEARFYPPASDWGTRLAVTCKNNGSPSQQLVVDINDASTFKLETQAEHAPRKIRVRPALTGDLSTLSTNDLLRQGYPPRPDSTANPDMYRQWVPDVSHPMDVYEAVLTSRLGVRGTGIYEGNFNTFQPAPWSAFVQSPAGFLDPATAARHGRSVTPAPAIR